jgi:hypothetical protein
MEFAGARFARAHSQTSEQRNPVDTVDEKSADEPALETWNRKPMKPNLIAP